MKKILLGGIFLLAFLTISWANNPQIPFSKFYGFIRLDTIYDTSKTYTGNLGLWLKNDTVDKGEFNITPKVTRFGYAFSRKGKGNEPGLEGKIEFDFFSGTLEDKANPRMRYAYFKLNYHNYSWIFGQHTDVFSPYNPYVADFGTLYYCGNPGYRIPQIRYTKTTTLKKGTKFKLALALAKPYAEKDLDADGIDDGGKSNHPDYQLLLEWKKPLSHGRHFNIALSGVYGQEKMTNPINGKTKFDIRGYSFGTEYMFTKNFKLKSELYKGQNLNSYKATVAYGINTTTGSEISSWGGWTQFFYKLKGGNLVTLGYGYDSNNVNDLLKMSANEVRRRNEKFFTNYTMKLRHDTKVVVEVARLFTSYLKSDTTTGNITKDYKIDGWRIQTDFIWTF